MKRLRGTILLLSFDDWDHAQCVSPIRITGTLLNYYVVCKRKAWLFSRGLAREHDSQIVQIGKLIHKTSFKRETKELLVRGRIMIDHITNGQSVVLHEVKKTRAKSQAAEIQLLFYLYELHALGVNCKGELHYRSEKRKKPVILDDEARERIEVVIKAATSLVMDDTPPHAETSSTCKKCAYRDFCRV